MTAFIFTRFAQSLLVLFIMSLLVFGGVNLVGDPVEMLINPEADQAETRSVAVVVRRPRRRRRARSAARRAAAACQT